MVSILPRLQNPAETLEDILNPGLMIVTYEMIT